MDLRPLSPTGRHQPVMVAEVLEGLSLTPKSHLVDGTAGGGGHLLQMLEQLGPDGRIFAFEKDPETRQRLQARVGRDPRVHLFSTGFENMGAVLASYRGALDAVFLDLGLSSLLLEQSGRGFSFRQEEEPLDMRFDPTRGEPLSTLLRNWSEESLFRILRHYGETRYARRLAHLIRTRPPNTVAELNRLVAHTVPSRRLHQELPRIYQAFRIAVNRELEALREGLVQACVLLREGGRLAVLTYHSLEDRVVKHLRDHPALSPLWKKGRTPTVEEVAANPRARSARLRVFIKTGEVQSHEIRAILDTFVPRVYRSGIPE